MLLKALGINNVILVALAVTIQENNQQIGFGA